MVPNYIQRASGLGIFHYLSLYAIWAMGRPPAWRTCAGEGLNLLTVEHRMRDQCENSTEPYQESYCLPVLSDNERSGHEVSLPTSDRYVKENLQLKFNS